MAGVREGSAQPGKPDATRRARKEMHMSNQQGQDGIAHVTYFDRRHSVSFVYDGTDGQVIDVCVGGYGEPAIARIECEEFDEDTPLGLALDAFQTRCQRFIDSMFAYEGNDGAA